jgi:Asp-tRNA(Asn)/Glu-tRNA(Gln) amidotransferase A subunit family amidase
MISLLDLCRRIEAGALSPNDALRESLAAIAQADSEIGAFVAVDAGVRSGGAGPLQGIAVAVKDIMDTADLPTEYGSPIYSGWRPKADASIVALLRRAGGSVIGKAATTPFAFLDPAGTRNPHNTAHTPGGSSSGSAAAVAAGMVPLAFGTQTGGSMIRPASYCGVAAIKPSFRILPTVGTKTYSWSLDTPGLFAATIADVAYALAALTGRDEVRVDRRAPEAPKIGLVLQDFAGDPEDASRMALEQAVSAASRAGATVIDLSLPDPVSAAFPEHPTIQDFEVRQALAWEYDHHRDALSPLLRDALDAAQGITPAQYDAARRITNRARIALRDVFSDCDVLLTYAAPGAAPKGLSSTGNSRFNRLWTLMGNPCVSVPGRYDEAGLPVGIQVIAAFGADDKALAAAAFLEKAIRDYQS